MNVDYKTVLEVDLGFEVNPKKPITTYSEEIINGRCATKHTHPRAQLIACNRGIMKVVVKDTIWIVNSMQAVWIAANEAHQVYFPNNVQITSVFIDPSYLEGLPTSSFTFNMSEFIRNLVSKLISFSNPSEFTIQQQRIADVFVDEIAQIKPTASFLPTSEEPRIEKVTYRLLQNIASKEPIDYYAKLACVSSRTLSRLFTKELGMSFTDWKTRAKLLEAMKQLGEHTPVKEIAYNLGYENSSSFIQVFKKYIGTTPASYMERKLSS